MKGYYNDPVATAETLIGGWLRTGDLAREDEDGYVYIVDRLKEMFKCKGFQVAPAEIEHVLLGHQDILDGQSLANLIWSWAKLRGDKVVRRSGSAVSPERIIEFAAHGMANRQEFSKVIFTDGDTSQSIRKDP